MLPRGQVKGENKNKLSKQLEQEQNHRNADHMEDYQGIRSINGRYKIERGRSRIVWEMEKPKSLHV